MLYPAIFLIYPKKYTQTCGIAVLEVNAQSVSLSKLTDTLYYPNFLVIW